MDGAEVVLARDAPLTPINEGQEGGDGKGDDGDGRAETRAPARPQENKSPSTGGARGDRNAAPGAPSATAQAMGPAAGPPTGLRASRSPSVAATNYRVLIVGQSHPPPLRAVPALPRASCDPLFGPLLILF